MVGYFRSKLYWGLHEGDWLLNEITFMLHVTDWWIDQLVWSAYQQQQLFKSKFILISVISLYLPLFSQIKFFFTFKSVYRPISGHSTHNQLLIKGSGRVFQQSDCRQGILCKSFCWMTILFGHCQFSGILGFIWLKKRCLRRMSQRKLYGFGFGNLRVGPCKEQLRDSRDNFLLLVC